MAWPEDVLSVDIPVQATFLGKISGSIRLSIEGTLRVTAKPPDVEPPVPPFVVGETYPDETTVGAGVIRPYPTAEHHGVLELYGDAGAPIVDTIFYDLVRIYGHGYTFENCVFRGPVERVEGSNIVFVDAQSSGTVLRYCDINPQTPSSHWNGIGYKRYRLEQCHVWGTTDCAAAFARGDDDDPSADVKIIGSWLERLSQFKPDVAGNRDVTHNDCIQLQGNVGPADDVLIDGSRLDGYHSSEQSEPSPPQHTQISAIMCTPNQQDQICLTLRNSWITGGIQTLNAGSSANALSVLRITDNIWEKPRSGGPTAAIALDPSITDRVVERNYYEDGSEVPVYNARELGVG